MFYEWVKKIWYFDDDYGSGGGGGDGAGADAGRENERKKQRKRKEFVFSLPSLAFGYFIHQQQHFLRAYKTLSRRVVVESHILALS